MKIKSISIRVIVYVMLFVSIPDLSVFSQTGLYHMTKLKDAEYFENKIKNISDEELFSSMNLKYKGLEKIRNYSKSKKYSKCFEEWEKYWISKKQVFLIPDNSELCLTFEQKKDLINSNKTIKENTLIKAEKILKHEINGWGDDTIKFGKTIDFNSNFGQTGKYGFHYWGWALPLVEAYLISNDAKYPKCFDDLFNQWYEQRHTLDNPYESVDVVYYELGLGQRNKVFLSNYYINYPERKLITHERMLKTMLGSARWLYEIQKNCGYRTGNWQAVGAYALALIGLAFPEFMESEQWVEIGVQRMHEHLKRDFFEDGGHSERSPAMYTQLTYGQIRNLYFIMEIFNHQYPEKAEFKKLLGKTVEWWLAMLTPVGGMPVVNDSHRKKFPKELLSDGANLFNIENSYGTLYNIYGVEKYKNASFPLFSSINLQPSGFMVMRSGWSKDALYMSINYGKDGGWHSHYDLLDFEIFGFGKPLVVDPGIGRTYDDPLHYPWYKTSLAHNMVVVNDSNMNRSEGKPENVISGILRDADYFSADNNGYKKFGVSHKRHIVFVKPKFWLIFDQIFSNNNNKISWNIHTMDSLDITSRNYYKSGNDTGLIIYPLEKYEAEIKKGFAMVKYSGQKDDFQQIPWLKFNKNLINKNYDEFAVLLIPYNNNIAIDFSRDSNNCFIVKYEDIENEIYFFDKIVKLNNIETDAKLVILQKKDGKIIKAQIFSGSYLKYYSRQIFNFISASNYEISY